MCITLLVFTVSDFVPAFKTSRSFSTFPTRTIVSKPCVFGSDKKSLLSNPNSSTCAHSSCIPTAASGRVRPNPSGASLETHPYLRQQRRSYKKGDPIASWVPFVRTPANTRHTGSSTGNSMCHYYRILILHCTPSSLSRNDNLMIIID